MVEKEGEAGHERKSLPMLVMQIQWHCESSR